MATIRDSLIAQGKDPSALPVVVQTTKIPPPLRPVEPAPPREPGWSELVASYAGRVREVGHNPSRLFLVAGTMAKNMRPSHANNKRVIIWSSQDEGRWRGKDVPAAVGFVFILRWTGHPASEALIDRCKRRDVPYAMGLSTSELGQLLDVGLNAKADVIAPVEEEPKPEPNTPPAWHRLAPPQGRVIEAGVLIDAVTRQPVSMIQTVRDLGVDISKRQHEHVDALLPVLQQWFPTLTKLGLQKAVSTIYIERGVRTINRRTKAEVIADTIAAGRCPECDEPLIGKPRGCPVHGFYDLSATESDPVAPNQSRAIEPPQEAPPVDKQVPVIEDALAAIDGATRALIAASDALQLARDAVLHARATASEDIAKLAEDAMLEMASSFSARIRGQK